VNEMRTITEIENTLCFTCLHYRDNFRKHFKKIVCVACSIYDPYMPAPRKKQCKWFDKTYCPTKRLRKGKGK